MRADIYMCFFFFFFDKVIKKYWLTNKVLFRTSQYIQAKYPQRKTLTVSKMRALTLQTVFQVWSSSILVSFFSRACRSSSLISCLATWERPHSHIPARFHHAGVSSSDPSDSVVLGSEPAGSEPLAQGSFSSTRSFLLCLVHQVKRTSWNEIWVLY